jgi:hypothetical protein
MTTCRRAEGVRDKSESEVLVIFIKSVGEDTTRNISELHEII